MLQTNPISATLESASLLLRHDLKIISTMLSRMVRKPSDLFTAVIAIPVLLMVWRAWLAGLSDILAESQTAGLGFLTAFYALKILLNRCAYHREDGALAADAQQVIERIAFAAPFGATALAASYILTFILGIHHFTLWLLGVAGGISVAIGWTLVSTGYRQRLNAWRKFNVNILTQTPRAMVIASLGAVLGGVFAIAPLRTDALVFFGVSIAILTNILLGSVNAEAVRFRTMSGEGSLSIVRSHIKRPIVFLVSFGAALALGLRWPALAATLLIAGLAAFFITIRVLAYQSFERRTAAWVLTASLAITALSGVMFPPLAAIALTVSVIWLARRAARERWLIS